MPQKPYKLNTGAKGLDYDLQVLLEVCGDKKKLAAIKGAIANKDISREDFLKIVPKALVILSICLTGPQSPIFLDKINEKTIDTVQKVKSLIEKHFGNLFENKNAKLMLESEVAENKQDHVESLADGIIHGIEYYFMWEDDPPELTPAIRIAYKNRKKKILLDTRLDWEDLSSHLNKLAEIFIELLEKGKTLAELGQIDLSDSQKVAENIEKTLESLQKAKEFMPIYKAKTETDKK